MVNDRVVDCFRWAAVAPARETQDPGPPTSNLIGRNGGRSLTTAALTMAGMSCLPVLM